MDQFSLHIELKVKYSIIIRVCFNNSDYNVTD